MAALQPEICQMYIFQAMETLHLPILARQDG